MSSATKNRRMRTRLVFVSFAVLLATFVAFFSSCGILDPSDYSVYRPLNGDLWLWLREAHNPRWTGANGPNSDADAFPEITLALQTKNELECANYILATHVTWYKPDHLWINVKGVARGRICLTAFGPADGIIRIPKDRIMRKLTLISEFGVDQYSVIISDTSIVLTPEQLQFTDPLDSLVWRYPRNSFVVLCGTATGASSLCEAFIDTLNAHLSLTGIDVPEIGYWPYTRETTGHQYNAPGRVFQYERESDFKIVADLTREYWCTVMRWNPGTGLTIINWRNESLRSYLFNNECPPDSVSGQNLTER